MQINSHLYIYLFRILKSLFFRKKSINSKIVWIENHLFAVEKIFSHFCKLIKWVLREDLFFFVSTRQAVREIFSHRRTITKSVSRKISQVNTKTKTYFKTKNDITIIIKCISRQNHKWTFFFCYFFTKVFNNIVNKDLIKLWFYKIILFFLISTRRAIKKIFSHRRMIARNVSKEKS